MLFGWVELGSAVNRFDELRVVAAAAQMSLHAGLDIVLGRMRILAEQADDAHDHAGRAETALRGALGQEGLLHGMQLAPFGESFDGQDFQLVRISYGRDARSHGFAVQQDGAGAALTFPAAVLRAGQFQFLPQDIQQGPLRISDDSSGLPVDSESDC